LFRICDTTLHSGRIRKKNRNVLRRSSAALLILCLCLVTGCGSPAKESTDAYGGDTAAVSTDTGGDTAAAATEADGDTETAATDSDSAETTEAAGSGRPVFTMDNYPYIDGSTANHPLLARIYMETMGVDRDTAGALVDFDLGSTGSIWENILLAARTPAENYKNVPDLLIVYEAPEDIKSEYAELFDYYEIEPLGRDGLVFLVNSENPVADLSTDQLRGIYTDKIHNWSEVGGNDEAVRPFQRNEDSGSQTLFMKLLMKGETPMEPEMELRVGTMDGLIDEVAAYDGSGNAIGYSVFYYANLMYANPSLKLLSVDGVAPGNKSIETGEYPLINDFYVVIRKSEPADSPVRALRDWLLTGEGRAILEDENYVWARSGLE